jgi:Protein of unknown function (DUF2587)
MTQPDPEEVVVLPHGAAEENPEESGPPDVESPAKVMRIASMARTLLEEVRHAPLDDASRARMREIYETSITELSDVLSPELKDELMKLSLPFQEQTPTDAELRIAHAQLVGWLEGLFHGIQAMLFAQQMENRARLEEMRRSLPGGPEGRNPQDAHGQPGSYL